MPKSTASGETAIAAAPPAQAPLSAADKAALLRALHAWYRSTRRDLPWRNPHGGPSAAYAVLVSEIMLQQTTVATVRPRFAAFMARFPTIEALAAAPLDDVLHEWQGLGYYRRARALHACARAVVHDHGGRLPSELERLQALPGIGPYTAAALRALAFDLPALPVDGNVERVLARLFAIQTPMPKAKREIAAYARALTPASDCADLGQAVMELGATICRPRQPLCGQCPWRGPCRARRAGIAEDLPVKAAKAARAQRHGIVFVLQRGDGALLFRKRPDDGLLAGLHELPGTPWTEAVPDWPAAAAQAPLAADWRLLEGEVRHVFTHFALSLRIAHARSRGHPHGLWCAEGEFARLALPTVMKKVLRFCHDREVLDALEPSRPVASPLRIG